MLDYFQGWGPSGMMILERRPDSNIVTEVVPSTASSSEVNEEGQYNFEILAVQMVRLRTIRAQGISSSLASCEKKDETSSWSYFGSLLHLLQKDKLAA